MVIHGVSLSALQNSEKSDMVSSQDVAGMVGGAAYFAHLKTAFHASGMRLVNWRVHH